MSESILNDIANAFDKWRQKKPTKVKEEDSESAAHEQAEKESMRKKAQESIRKNTGGKHKSDL